MTYPNQVTPWSEEVYLAEVERVKRADHTGTLDTTGHGDGDADRTLTRNGYTFEVGPDVSAAGISPVFDPLDPLALPDGYVAGPVYDGPIY